MNIATLTKFERRVVELDEKICDERRKVRNKSYGGSVFALKQWEKERAHYMNMLREGLCRILK